MRQISQKTRKVLDTDRFYKQCARRGVAGHYCEGRLTMDHAVIYAGRQVDKPWAIVPLCAKAHSVDYFQDGGEHDKEISLWIALNRASDDELREVSKAIPYNRERARLNLKYGFYTPPVYNPYDVNY